MVHIRESCKEEKNLKKFNALEVHQNSVFKCNIYDPHNCVLLIILNMEMLYLSPELIHKDIKDDQRDYLFYLAVANYKLKVVVRAFHMFM